MLQGDYKTKTNGYKVINSPKMIYEVRANLTKLC